MAAQGRQLQTTPGEPVSAYEKALVFGDVAGLSERDRLEYLKQLAASVGLDPISRPFGYLPNRGTLTVYLTATGAAQLRRIHNVSITEILDEGIVEGFYRVKGYGKMPNGRVDVEIGSVSVTDREGKWYGPQEIENCRKKAITQMKTRLTKSMVGLSGVLAEEEIDDIPDRERGAPVVPQLEESNGHTVDTATGEVTPAPKRRLDPKAPLAARGYEVLRGMARKLHALDPSQELVDVRDGLMTNEDAVELQVRLAEWIEAAEARGTPEEVLPT